MEFTTRLGLHSQATRLLGEALLPSIRDRYGPGTLYGSWPRSRGTWIASTRQDNEPSQTPHFPRANDSRDSVLGFSRFARRYSGNPG